MKFPLTAVVCDLSCTGDHRGNFSYVMPGSLSSRDSDLAGVGCDLALGILKSSSGSSNVPPKLTLPPSLPLSTLYGCLLENCPFLASDVTGQTTYKLRIFSFY